MNFLKRYLLQRREKSKQVDLRKRFDIIGGVGQGSMSRVWRARDNLSGRTVALKVLDKHKTRQLEARFVGRKKPTEGEVATHLHHPHIVQTYEHGVSTQGSQFLVMEFVDGIGLSYLVEMQNELMQANRLRFIVEIGEALSYFHSQGFIHRDLCPRNVLLDREYSVKLIDFGLAVPDTEPFRQPGNRTGTASYMAPELIKRQRTDQRIDVYSFAVSCYEMYTRKFPWETGGMSLQAAMQHINQPPHDIRDLAPEIDEQLAETIMKGLEVTPRDRWQTVGEMLTPLRQARSRLEPVQQVAVKDDEFEEV